MGRGRGRGGGDRDAQYTTAAAEEDAARGSSQLGQKGGERVGIRARAITEKRAGSTTRPHGHAYLGLDLGRVGQGVCPTSRGGGAGGGKRRRHCRGARGDRAKPGGEIDRLAHRAQQERRARDRVHVGTRRRVARHHRVQQLPQLGGEGLLQLWARRGRRPVDDRVDEVKVRRVVRVRVPAEDPLEANQPDRPNVRGEAVHAAVDEPFGRHVGGGAWKREKRCGALARWLHRARDMWAAVPQYVAAIACVASSSREIPKSESLTNPDDVRSTLAGLRSRCTARFSLCKYVSP
mmetsp:Transcript_35798/g.115110  ORF Transcript_35798/g.115110 Transcript_35798/m.115110 type:complete len:292 (+) Transcript_35798:27-902(+)